MRNIIIFAIALLLFAAVCLAQPTIEWQRCLGGSDFDDAYYIQQTSDGGFIVAGASASYDGDVSGHHHGGALDDGIWFEYPDYWVVKLNSVGAIVWQKSLGGSYWDKAESIQQTSDGGFIVAGESYSDDGDVSGHHGIAGYPPDYWVVKLNSAGDIEWQKSLGGSGYDEAASIQQTSDGGFIVAGKSWSNDGDVSGHHGTGHNYDYWVVKLNSVGAIVWQKSLGGSFSDHASSVQQTSDGGYILAGYTHSNDGDVSGNHGYYDYWVVKLNSSGDIVWQKCLGGSHDDYANSIQQTSDGGFIVAGYTCSNDGDVSGWHEGADYPYYDYWVVKLNSGGDIIWQKCLGGSNEDEAYSIQQTSDGGFIVAGASNSNDGDVSGHHGSTVRKDYWVVKLNSGGDIIWQKCLGGSNFDDAYSIQQTTDGGFIVAGLTYSNDDDVSGWHEGYDSWGNSTCDYWIVKLSPEEGISDDNNGLQPLAYTISAYPNPFNSSCAITAPANADVEIYDIMGNIVGANSVRPIDKGRMPYAPTNGARTFIWTPDKSISSGIYLVRATMDDGRTTTKRIVYVR